MPLPDEILAAVATTPGLTDRELTSALRGASAPQQPVNQAARSLEAKGRLIRKRRSDGLIGNYPNGAAVEAKPRLSPTKKNHDVEALSEDEIKKVLVDWLSVQGWECEVAWGNRPGIDIDARRAKDRWIVEVKGPGSRPPMRVNYFLAILGETLQRMNDPNARYSVALPDLPQYRGLWERLPPLAKDRTTITMLFVDSRGNVVEGV